MSNGDPQTLTPMKGEGGSGSLSPLERFLQLFAEMKPGEGITVVLMFVNIFLVLTAYYVLKVVREALTIGGVEVFGLPGDEIKAYLPAVMAVLLLFIVPAYGYFASKLDRITLIKRSMLLVIGVLAGFFLWGSATGVGTAIGLSFYIFLGIINVFLIAQFWSFANDIYTEKQGKRLFAVIAIGQSLGAVLGPKIAALGAKNTFALLAVSAVIFACCLLLFVIADKRERASIEKTDTSEPEPLEGEGGFKLVFSNRYLLLIAFMILTTNIINTTGEYILSNAAKRNAVAKVPAATVIGEALAKKLENDPKFKLPEDEAKKLKGARSKVIGQFYGDFFFYVNLFGLLIQMFFVSRIFKLIGVRAALFVLPLIAFGGYAAIGLFGGLLVLRIAKTAENSIDYSLQNTVKQALFLPTSREAKYKAKQAIDTFFVRFGDAASAGLVAVGLHMLHFGAKAFAFVNVGLALIWIALNVGIAREHKKLTKDT